MDDQVYVSFTQTVERTLTGSYREVAKALGVTVRELRRAVREGDLPELTDRSDLNNCIESAEVDNEEFELTEVGE